MYVVRVQLPRQRSNTCTNLHGNRFREASSVWFFVALGDAGCHEGSFDVYPEVRIKAHVDDNNFNIQEANGGRRNEGIQSNIRNIEETHQKHKEGRQMEMMHIFTTMTLTMTSLVPAKTSERKLPALRPSTGIRRQQHS